MSKRRAYGSGQLYIKHGSYFGRWRTLDGRRLNRRIGKLREPGSSEGLTKTQAERAFRKLQEEEERRPRPTAEAAKRTVSDAADSLRRRLALDGARKSYLEGCESMQRVHIAPAMGEKPLERVKRADVEALGAAMLAKGRAPKTARNVLKFLHSVFEYAIDEGWCRENPVRQANRRRHRRSRDTNPDLQFLSVSELEAVIRAIPDVVVVREPAPTRRGRAGSAPPPPPDVLGPVLRVLIGTAAMTGLRQSELLGLRWRDVDWQSQRVRVRHPYVRGEFSSEGKSDLSTRRSVPMADRVAADLDQWSRRSAYTADDDLVFAHPQSGRPLDRSKVSKRFKQACADAGVRPVRFHDLRHTFATRLAASGESLRTIQEFLGHADAKTTQIYAHYAPSKREVDMVNAAFADPGSAQSESGVLAVARTASSEPWADGKRPGQ